ncbi:MAG: phosphonate ABC transporter, permease protein PhnE [Alphaproteobacteria bacterium]|nr:phosphonate ABC transporter, permease protein PhnE [Alphaproteobacteria bacterium]
MTATAIGLNRLGRNPAIARAVARRARLSIALAAAVFAYLTYAWFAFDMPGLIESARPERAALLATDSVAHKVHVTRSTRTGDIVIAVEGERTATYDTPPGWVTADEESASIDLGDGYRADILGNVAYFYVPGYGEIVAEATSDGVVTTLPKDGPQHGWLRASDAKFDARPTIDRRVQVSRAKIEVHRYFFGWENFFFPFNSEINAYSAGDLFSLAFGGPPLRNDMSNAAYIFDTFWTNPDWQHGNVFIALLETLLMAVLGTFTAAFVGLPLALLAARNFTINVGLMFVVRRLFDLLRGIDMLIWSLIFIRSFGLGPLTGALAIAFTDTGTLGKLFSEALENVDDKQIEGVRSTGASKLQVYRYGVIPQILPIFVSQGLYYLESNMRSATVIGALGAGGIGLMLVETMRTSRDWENTLYIILLTVMLVIAMDSLSSWLRRRLIQGKSDQTRPVKAH